eukprot:COSAG01_NODE_1861_length_9039_cov_6.964094_5_plen_239_part_00
MAGLFSLLLQLLTFCRRDCSLEELIIILEKKWRDVHDAASAAESQILRKFLRLMLDVLCPVCRDLLELQRLLFEMLPKVASAMERETSLAESTDGTAVHDARPAFCSRPLIAVCPCHSCPVALRSCAAGGMYPELHSVARPILGLCTCAPVLPTASTSPKFSTRHTESSVRVIPVMCPQGKPSKTSSPLVARCPSVQQAVMAAGRRRHWRQQIGRAGRVRCLISHSTQSISVRCQYLA